MIAINEEHAVMLDNSQVANFFQAHILRWVARDDMSGELIQALNDIFGTNISDDLFGQIGDRASLNSQVANFFQAHILNDMREETIQILNDIFDTNIKYLGNSRWRRM